MHHFRTRRRIEFSDTDQAGVVHFARFFVFMETAEDEFLRTLGGGFTMEAGGRALGWPKVAASCDYLSPARYGDTLEIGLRVLRKTSRSLTYAFDFRAGERAIARGRTTSVCCATGKDGHFEPVRIPSSLAKRIAVDPAAPDPGA